MTPPRRTRSDRTSCAFARQRSSKTLVCPVFGSAVLGKAEFMTYSRFAVYYLPPDGALATSGATWLGWDVATGQTAGQPDLPGLDDITMTPRKYGFHGTLKPPFHPADGTNEAELNTAVAQLASRTPPARCGGLELATIGRFLALVPTGNTEELRTLAGACVSQLDRFRAAPHPDELARRRRAGLSPRQEALLLEWGYPYVMDEFRFHLTLSGPLDQGDAARWMAHARMHLSPLPTPFVVDQIALCGERSDGCFELIQRHVLTG